MANTRRASAGSKKGAARNSGARKSPARKPANKARDNETKHDLLSLFYFGVATLILFVAIIRSDSFSALYAVKQFFWGVFGHMTWALPAMFVWLGAITMKSFTERGRTLKYGLLVALMFLCAFSAVEAFCIEGIERNMEIRSGYINFLSFAYNARIGGGLFGALLAWPVHRLLTEWGALLLFSLLAMLALTGLRALSIQRLKRRVSKKWHDYKDAHPPKPKAPRQRPAREAPARAGRGDVKLYVEKIKEPIDIDPGSVKPPKLSRKGARLDVTSVESPVNEFEIPNVAPPKPGRARTAKQTSAAPAPIDLMSAVKAQDENERNSAYIRNALDDHSRAPKPVLTYEIGNRTSRGGDESDMFDPGFTYAPSNARKSDSAPKVKAQTPPQRAAQAASAEPARESAPVSAPAPVKRAPAQPKPSFFDEQPVSAPAKPDKQPPETEFTPQVYTDDTQLEYSYPPIDLMDAGDFTKTDGGFESADMQRAETLIKTLQSFSIPVKLTGIAHGPAVTRFELMPAPGIKVSRIASLSDDLAMNLAAVAVRIEAPIPGKSAVGVEVPNSSVEIVHLRDVLESQEARRNSSRLAVGLGKDNAGNFVVADLAKMPHLLIAGQTGSGKSVCINAIIISILYRATPDEVRMILIDPKMVELTAYNRIPHLLVPVVTDVKKAASALDWAVGEMTRRYKAFSERGAKDIKSYNTKLKPDEKPMPQIVLIVDELADLMMTTPRDVEDAINRLAQLARAAGIHLVIATQRPSVDVITGLIKANIPSRIAFTVSSGVDSRTILDSYGAEKLLGRGDMLFLPPTRNKPQRVQGAWVSEEEVQDVVDYITGHHETDYNEDVIEHMENAVLSDAEKDDKRKDDADGTDELFSVAVKHVVDAGQASISMLQRKLRVGYARAGRLIDEMAARGLVSQSEGSKSREVLISREQYRVMFNDDDDIAGMV